MKLCLLLFAGSLCAQQVIVLRPAPGAPPERVEERGTAQAPDRSISQVAEPTLTAYLPEAATATGESMIICPGGGTGTWPSTKKATTWAAGFNRSATRALC